VSSTTAYALVETESGGSLHWFGASQLGFHETVSNWVRTQASETIATGTLAGKVQYDNSPAVTPLGGPNALVSVRFTDMTIQSIGPLVGVRKDGELVVTLRYPIELGDAVILAKANAISEDFMGATVPVDVEFYGPSVGRLGLGGGYYEIDVRAPFYRLHSPERPVGDPASPAASWDEIADVVRARFKLDVADVLALPTAYDNAPNPSSGGVRWARWTVLPGLRRRVETPGGYRSGGVAIASVFVPTEGGDAPAYRVADKVYESFTAVTDTGVSFGIPNVRTIGRTGTSPWWQVNVDCPFSAFHAA
jgi:hypothetical protein